MQIELHFRMLHVHAGLHTGEWLQWVMRLLVIYSGVRNYTEIHVYLYFENVQAGYWLVISVVNEDSTTAQA